MAEVRHRRCAERALGLLDGEMVRAQSVEHRTNMLQMLCPRRAIDENIIEEDEHESSQEGPEDVVHQRLEG